MCICWFYYISLEYPLMHVFYLCKANAPQNGISNHMLKHAFESQWQELENIRLYSCLTV